MTLNLLSNTIAFLAAAAVVIGFGIFVLLKNPRKVTNVTYFFVCITMSIYAIDLAIATNISDPQLAYFAWFFNVIDIFISIFYAHWILAVLNRTKTDRAYIWAVYIVGFLLFLLIVFNPDLFLPRVVPKMYFKSYLDAGLLYYVMVAFFFLVTLYPFARVIQKHRVSKGHEKNRLKYFLFATPLGYVVGPFGFFLVFDIPIDPSLSPLMAVHIVPLAYGIVRERLWDIELVIKRAFIYSVVIALVAGLLVAVTLLSNWFVENVPGFNFWTIPFLAAVVAFLIGHVFWSKSQESDKLKYEFITVAAHKLRTPVTQIRWEVENMAQSESLEEIKKAARSLRGANRQLIKLSDVLLRASETDIGRYIYKRTDVDLGAVVKAVIDEVSGDVKKKRITLTMDIEDDLPLLRVDAEKIASAVQVLVENAKIYTSKGGFIVVQLRKKGDDDILFSVKDSGIGISKDDLPHVFDKFYRAKEAKTAYTEGMGLGLFMSKDIIERHGGKMGIESEGVGHGSEFWFLLPIETEVEEIESAQAV